MMVIRVVVQTKPDGPERWGQSVLSDRDLSQQPDAKALDSLVGTKAHVAALAAMDALRSAGEL